MEQNPAGGADPLVSLIALVQSVQSAGDALARKLNRRVRHG